MHIFTSPISNEANANAVIVGNIGVESLGVPAPALVGTTFATHAETVDKQVFCDLEHVRLKHSWILEWETGLVEDQCKKLYLTVHEAVFGLMFVNRLAKLTCEFYIYLFT